MHEAAHGPIPERRLRLASGLILFAYVICHFAAHASGIFLVPAMEATSRVLLMPWKGWLGQGLLYGALVIHLGLGLRALYRRRHLRMPAAEAAQLALGLLIPLLAVNHVVNVRLGNALYGLDDSYWRLLYSYWVDSPTYGLPRQMLLLVIVWIHGCIGVRYVLRYRDWYPHWAPALAALATLLPVLAVVGIVNAGWEVVEIFRQHPEVLQHYLDAGDTQAADRWLDVVTNSIAAAYVVLVAGVFGLRRLRDWHTRRFNAVGIRFPDGGEARVPRGYSVLDASRWSGRPHTAVCGGRGRCSTCRVRILRGGAALPPPNAAERAVLERIQAPADVRLACQLRPTGPVEVMPMVPSDSRRPALAAALAGQGQERMIAALFVDLRDSTRLAADRLPYDALFILDRYLQTVIHAVERQGGLVTSIAGDGVMSIFGAAPGVDAATACRQAIAAACRTWRALDELSGELGHVLEEPLRFGFGLHAGPSVIGVVAAGGTDRSVQFLGDTGNVAARLEALTKTHGCPLILSEAAAAHAGLTGPGFERSVVELRGRPDGLGILLVRDAGPLERAIGVPA
jgi:adenylate cyclase